MVYVKSVQHRVIDVQTPTLVRSAMDPCTLTSFPQTVNVSVTMLRVGRQILLISSCAFARTNGYFRVVRCARVAKTTIQAAAHALKLMLQRLLGTRPWSWTIPKCPRHKLEPTSAPSVRRRVLSTTWSGQYARSVTGMSAAARAAKVVQIKPAMSVTMGTR